MISSEETQGNQDTLVSRLRANELFSSSLLPSPPCSFVLPKSHPQLSQCPRAPPAPRGITHGTGGRNAAVLLLHATLLGLPRALRGRGLLCAWSPWARPLLSCALLLLQDAPSVQDTARTQPRHQRATSSKSHLSSQQETKVKAAPQELTWGAGARRALHSSSSLCYHGCRDSARGSSQSRTP